MTAILAAIPAIAPVLSPCRETKTTGAVEIDVLVAIELDGDPMTDGDWVVDAPGRQLVLEPSCTRWCP